MLSEEECDSDGYIENVTKYLKSSTCSGSREDLTKPMGVSSVADNAFPLDESTISRPQELLTCNLNETTLRKPCHSEKNDDTLADASMNLLSKTDKGRIDSTNSDDVIADNSMVNHFMVSCVNFLSNSTPNLFEILSRDIS